MRRPHYVILPTQEFDKKYILIRRKQSDTYLATVSRHCWSLQIAKEVDKVCSFQPALRPSSAEEEDITIV